MPITPVSLPPLRSQGKTQAQFSAEFEAFAMSYYQSVIDFNAAASAYQLSVTNTAANSVLIGTGSKTFTVLAGSGYYVGMPVRAANSATNHMTGEVSSYSGTTLVINVTAIAGTGTFTSWVIGPAAVGANSAGSVSFAPTGNIAATNVQAAIAELDTEKLSSAAGAVTGVNLEDITTAETVGTALFIPAVTKDVNGRITGVTSNRVAYTPNFTSAAQTINFSSVLSVAHGLGVNPTFYFIELECATAELGYAVGEVVFFMPADASGVNSCGISADATNVSIVMNANIRILNKTTRSATVITAANWRFRVKAWI